MPIKALVIPGGGLNFFVYYGIIKTLQQLERYRTWIKKFLKNGLKR